jgi:hypothetical protein
MGPYDIYITASNEKFSVHPIPAFLSPHFFSKSNTKHGNIKQLHNRAYFQKHNVFFISVNLNVVS